MRGEIDFDNLFISAPYGSGDIYESVEISKVTFLALESWRYLLLLGPKVESGEFRLMVKNRVLIL